MKRLSEKRIRLLRLLAQSQQREEFPLVAELAQRLSLAGRSSISRMLDALEAEGYLSKHGGGRRQQNIYRLTAKAWATLPDAAMGASLPVLGSIPAGPLCEAVQECEEFCNPGDCLRVQPGDFMLQIKGESMIGDGILPGDLVLLRPNIQVANGEIAAVQFQQEDGGYEATLKHVCLSEAGEAVELRASNPAYGPIRLTGSKVVVVGVYRGLIRPAPTVGTA